MATAGSSFFAALNQQMLHGQFRTPLYNRQGASGDDT